MIPAVVMAARGEGVLPTVLALETRHASRVANAATSARLTSTHLGPVKAS